MAPHPTAGPGPREARAAGRGARDCAKAEQGCSTSPLPPTRPLSHARTQHVTASPDLPLSANSQGFEGESIPGLLRSCTESALHVFATGVCSEPASHLSPVPCAWVMATPARTGVSSSGPASPCPVGRQKVPDPQPLLGCWFVWGWREGGSGKERREGHPRSRGPPQALRPRSLAGLSWERQRGQRGAPPAVAARGSQALALPPLRLEPRRPHRVTRGGVQMPIP